MEAFLSGIRAWHAKQYFSIVAYACRFGNSKKDALR